MKSRRNFLGISGATALAIGLKHTHLVLADESSATDISQWLNRLDEISSKLASDQVSPLEWQEVMDHIYAAAPINKLKRTIDFGRLSREILETMPSNRREYFHRIDLPFSNSGDAERRKLINKIAHVRKGESIPPHGHCNMASAFLCLSGEFEVRLYDRLEYNDQCMVVRQSRHDKAAGIGTWSSISDYRDNVHWLTAKTDDCFLFTSKLVNVEARRELRGRVNIDLRSARALGSNTYRSPIISSQRAAEIY